MGFQCGIVGLPNVGKSTLFNALTRSGIAAENYPFCTIEPNVGMVEVPDPRLDAIATWVQPQQVIPTHMRFVDIAGLVEGASKGEGLGNQFLAHIRETQAIAHVVRCHGSSDVVHVAGRVDPVADVQTIELELCLADLETVEKAAAKAAKEAKSGNKEAKQRVALCEVLKQHLDAGQSLRVGLDDEAAQALARELQCLSMKPVLYVGNVGEQEGDNAAWQALADHAASQGAGAVPMCATIEQELADLDADDRAAFLADLGWDEPGLNRLIRAGYGLLDLQTFFTAGPKEVRAWTVRRGTPAQQAAGVIHTDFIKGFIRAEVIGYEDFVRHQGEAGAKEAGVWRLEGKDYVVQDGDVVFFRVAS